MDGETTAKGAAAIERSVARRFLRNERGSTAIEFAMVMPPFLVLVLGILTIALQFFTTVMLEVSVQTASRKLRTGAAQAQGLNLGDFKKLVCDASAGTIACGSQLSVLVASAPTFSELGSGPSCVSGSSMTSSPPDNSSMSSLTGSNGRAVMVTVCYTWGLGGTLWSQLKNFVSVAPLVDGKCIISARSLFRLEG